MNILLIVSIILIIFVIYYWYTKDEKSNIYVSLTTIPERIINPWFYNNLKHLMNLNGNYKVILNVPYYFKRNNKPYIIPDNVKDLEKDNLIINRINIDYGPLTKLYGTLLNDTIPDNSALLICDDDIVYNKDFITIIYNKYKVNSNKLYTYCYNTIEGYKGYMVKKSIIKPIINFKRPESCFRIDDNFIQESVKKLNIEIIPVSYNNDTSWTCTFDINIHDNHTPKWPELKSDHRPPMIQKCIYDFNNIN
tara:strand:- start:995 stop:1744 length:750 start_codon:yes stop_codon:yes gene_type:complete